MPSPNVSFVVNVHARRSSEDRPVTEELPPGLTNRGAVTQSGNQVLRPAGPHTPAVHALLQHIRQAGFAGAPLPVGIDDDGRERLELIEGDVAHPPYPAWAQTDRALESIGRLLRRFHEAARGFDPADHSWSEALADPVGGATVCHNDLELSNIVFRNGVAVAFIDFEFAAPGRRMYDLAHLARLCVPLEHDVDSARMGWSVRNRPGRLRLLADAYGLVGEERRRLPDVIDDALDRIEALARRNHSSGDPADRDAIRRTGGLEKYERRRTWWAVHRGDLARALGSGPFSIQ